MTKYEVVKKTLAHQSIDTIPYAINMARTGFEAHGQKLFDRYASSQIKEDYAQGNLDFSMALSLALGNFVLNVKAPWWNWAAGQENYKLPDTPEYLPHAIGSGNYDAFFKQMAYIKEHYDVYILVTVWGSHFEKAYFSRGIENFLADIAGEPEYAQTLLDTIIRKNLVMLENFLVCPHIDGVLLGSDWGTQNDLIMSPDSWRNLIKDGELQEYNLIKSYGKDVFIHSCGNIQRILPDLCEMGVDALNPIQPECMDIYRLKEQFGDKLTFWGAISTQQTLPYGTPAEVEAECCKIVKAMSVGGGYITSPSQEIQEDVPYDNLITLIETAKSFAKM